MAEWISVKDRLPEEYKCCLCYTNSRRIMEATLDGEGNWYDEDLDECYVTHWMPMLEPPEEDSEC